MPENPYQPPERLSDGPRQSLRSDVLGGCCLILATGFAVVGLFLTFTSGIAQPMFWYLFAAFAFAGGLLTRRRTYRVVAIVACLLCLLAAATTFYTFYQRRLNYERYRRLEELRAKQKAATMLHRAVDASAASPDHTFANTEVRTAAN